MAINIKAILLNLFVLITLVCARKRIPIGAIFDIDNDDAEIAFRYAVIRENMYGAKISFVPITKVVDLTDTYEAEQAVCSLVAEGVAAIFESQNNQFKYDGVIGSVCNELGIPHFLGHWSPELPEYKREFRSYTRNFFPSSGLFSRALADLIVDYDWTAFTIIYEDEFSLMRLHDVLQIHDTDSSPIVVRKLEDDGDYMPMLKEIAAYGETRIILDCSQNKVLDVLRQAIPVKMLEDYQNYIITTVDAHTIDFNELQYNRANITTFRMINPSSVDAETAVHDWRQGEYRKNGHYNVPPDKIKSGPALIHDAVRMFSSSVREHSLFNSVEVEQLDCLNPAVWSQGRPILDLLDKKMDERITGRITFNENFERNYFTLDIVELSVVDGLKKIATWDPTYGINMTRALSEVYSQISLALSNRTMIVVSRIGMPYLDYKDPEEGEVLEGNDRFHGYSMDLIDGISKILGFKYTFYITPDNAYGSYNKETKSWNGLVRELLEHKADMAICDLTITYSRRAAVDFTMPFMTLGISIIYANPDADPPNLFSFMSPLSLKVWLHMATAYLVMTLALLLLSRMAADDWDPAHPGELDGDEPEELENIWNMPNCFWLTVGSIMQQGCDILPKAASTRVALSMWFFFALIIISSYTANLAAFLTSSRMGATIKSADDLAKQQKIQYGAVLGGSTMQFFKESNFSTYQRMWSAMESFNPSPFMSSNKEGIERILKKKGDFAFLMESSQIEYMTQQNCNLTQVGGQLDSKGYGIALPPNSPYRTHISQAVLKMQEDGKLHQLKEKWWDEMNPKIVVCDDGGGDEDSAKMGLGNVGGVFLVLGAGLLVAILVGIIDFLWNIRQIAIDERITPNDALIRELKFVTDLSQETKPVGKGLEDGSQSTHSSDRSLKSAISKESIKSIESTKTKESKKHDDV